MKTQENQATITDLCNLIAHETVSFLEAFDDDGILTAQEMRDGLTLLAAVDPDAVAISVGYNNYGHPTPETLGRIQAQGAAVYRTDYEGHIIFTAPEGEES